MNSDILIVGGGVIGLMCGWKLQDKGLRVTIIDAAKMHADKKPVSNLDTRMPTTLAAAGMLAPSFEAGSCEKAGRLDKFGWHSLSLWPETADTIEAESGVSIDYRKHGTFGVALTRTELEELKHKASIHDDRDHKFEWLTANEIRHLEPALSPEISGGYFSPTETQLDPKKLYDAIKNAFLNKGGAFLAGTQVTEILQTSGKVTGVRTNKDDQVISAPFVIIANGAFLARKQANSLLGISTPTIIPVKGEALAVTITPNQLTHVVRHPDVYLCPKSDGRLIIGATSLPGRDDLKVEESHISDLREKALNLLKKGTKLSFEHQWAGIRPSTPDGLPVIGKYPETPEGLIFAVGHFRNGILLAPATADLICQIITGDIKEASVINPFTSTLHTQDYA